MKTPARKSRTTEAHGKHSVGLRPGFTLVEMLVAVALVLLMMTMFAQIFQLAGGTITKQRGIAENDQRSRSLQNILKADLDKRTYRLVMPWANGEDGTLPETLAIDRQGYLYISENDPDSDEDDELKFTINIINQTKNRDLTPLYGKATQIPNASLLNHPNQPEADDGWTVANGSAESPAAEVCYFLRGGKLYRRVLLIRRPLPLAGAIGQPTFNDDRDIFDYTSTATPAPYPQTGGTTGNTTFWDEFDYSAFLTGSPAHAAFHSTDDLSNASTQTQFPLGNPRYRFGHRTDNGRPREFDSNGVYFGAFLHEETSNANFNYPQSQSSAISGTINPYIGSLTLNTTTNVFDDFVNGPRRGEDLLMSNVHGFDVKVWDDVQNAFVDLGGTGVTTFGTAQRLQNGNGQYGPVNVGSPFSAPYDQNRVFDTWHPAAAIDLDNDMNSDPPPFRHLNFGRGSLSGSNGYGKTTKNNWAANQAYNVGDLVFPLNNQRANGLRFVYRCVAITGGGQSGATEPTASEWPAAAGARIVDNQVLWEAVDNWRPLRAIQITIRFYDVTSDQMRQQTIVHSLID